MNFYNLTSGIFILLFPGLLFIIVSLPIWLIFSNYVIKKVDKAHISVVGNIREIIIYLQSLRKENGLSNNFLFIITSFLLLIASNSVIISSLFNSHKVDVLIILTLFLMSLLLKMFFANLSMKKQLWRLVDEFIVLLSFIIWVLSLNLFNLRSIMRHPFIYDYGIYSIQFFLIIIIITTIGNLSAYMDYNHNSVFFSSLDEINEFNHKQVNENWLEKLVRWLLESYTQLLYTLLLVLFIIPYTFNFSEPFADWYYVMVLFSFWLFFMIVSQLIGLIDVFTENLGRQLKILFLFFFLLTMFY